MSNSNINSNIFLAAPAKPQAVNNARRDMREESGAESSENFQRTFHQAQAELPQEPKRPEASRANNLHAQKNSSTEKLSTRGEKLGKSDEREVTNSNQSTDESDIKNKQTTASNSADSETEKTNSTPPIKAEDSTPSEFDDASVILATPIVQPAVVEPEKNSETVVESEVQSGALIDSGEKSPMLIASENELPQKGVGDDKSDAKTLQSGTASDENTTDITLEKGLTKNANAKMKASLQNDSKEGSNAKSPLLTAADSSNLNINQTPIPVAGVELGNTNPSSNSPENASNVLKQIATLNPDGAAENPIDVDSEFKNSTNGQGQEIAGKNVLESASKNPQHKELGESITPDSKTAFEKMLQGASRENPSGADASVRQSTPLATTLDGSSASSTFDSLFNSKELASPATRNFVVQTAVPVTVGQPQWSQAVGEKVLWLAAQNVTSAEIHLHPKDLGPIQVNVSVNQDQASVNFTSHHPAVREVLDQGLNRLREMFAEQGLNLANVDVSEKSFSRQQQDAKGQNGKNAKSGEDEEAAPAAISMITTQRLVDHYA